jgi:hypothetical protein
MASRWEVEILGDRLDLEELPEWLSSPDLRVHVRNGEYFLSGTELDRFTDAGDAHQFAVEVIEKLNALGQLLWSEFEPVRVGAVLSGSGRQVFAVGVAVARARVKGKATVVRADGTKVPPSYAFAMFQAIQVASSDPVVARVLRFLQPPEITWSDLYRALEAIEEDAGDVSKRGWTSSTQRGRFRHTANSFSALGMDARHGTAKEQQPAKPMTLSEARALILGLATRWLQTK